MRLRFGFLVLLHVWISVIICVDFNSKLYYQYWLNSREFLFIFPLISPSSSKFSLNNCLERLKSSRRSWMTILRSIKSSPIRSRTDLPKVQSKSFGWPQALPEVSTDSTNRLGSQGKFSSKCADRP